MSPLNNSKHRMWHQDRDMNGLIVVEQPKPTYGPRLVESLAIRGPQNTPRLCQHLESLVVLHLGRIWVRDGTVAGSGTVPAGSAHQADVARKPWFPLSPLLLSSPSSFSPKCLGVISSLRMHHLIGFLKGIVIELGKGQTKGVYLETILVSINPSVENPLRTCTIKRNREKR